LLRKLGHDVRLMAVPLITPYRTKQKYARNDAAAICEAVSRLRMRLVPIKTVEQHAVLAIHRARALLVSERTAVANQMRGLLLEYGIALSGGIRRLRRELPHCARCRRRYLPPLARTVVTELRARLRAVEEHIAKDDQQTGQLARQNEAARRLMQLESEGPPYPADVVGAGG
jgi:transposase